MPSVACPTRDDLDSFQAGRLEDPTLGEVSTHVENCQACQKMLETVIGDSADTILSALLDECEPAPFSEEPTCRTAVKRAATLADDSSTAGDQSQPTVDLAAPLPTAPAESLPLVAIREYKLLSKLGEGGMGAVYKALHTKLDKVVALKVLPADRMRDLGAVARFQREMKAVGKLDHPNIVRAMDAGEEAGMHFLVMEYVEGLDLSQLAKNTGPLPVADACELVRQAALGLAEAHEHGMVHRDIKPSNLILAKPKKKTGQPTVKILDLGLALLSEALAPDAGGLTTSGQMMGTIDYMAPEQGGDSHQVDIRADIYSLGATLYRLLTGSAPFAGEKFDTPVKKLMALATQAPAAVQSSRPDVPPALAGVLNKMLAKSPAARYATPEELAEALAPYCQTSNLAALLAGGTSAVGNAVPGVPSREECAPSAEIGTQNHLSSPSGDTAPTIDRAAVPGAVGNAVPGVPAAGTGAAAGVNRRGHAASSGRKIPRSLAIAAACGGLALAVLLGITFYIQTQQGTIQVEINDPVIKVVLDNDGNTVFQGVDKKHEIKLKPGPHGLTITRGDFSFDTTKFELKRKEKLVLKVEYLPGKIQVADVAGKVLDEREIPGDAPDFDGKDYALAFDGAKSYVLTPLTYDGEGPITIEATVTVPPGGFDTRALVGNFRTPARGPGGASLHLTPTGWAFHHHLRGVEHNLFVATKLSPGEPVRLAGVWDGKACRLFENGKLLPSARSETTAYPSNDDELSFALGAERDVQGFGWKFAGTLNEIRISRSARYQSNYAPLPRLPDDADTLVLYHCDDGQGEVLTDSSGNNHHGKIVGAKWVKAESASTAPAPRPRGAEGLAFNGQGDHVRLPMIPIEPREPITVEAWFTSIAGEKPGAESVEAKTDALIMGYNPAKKAGFGMVVDREKEAWFVNRYDERFTDANYYWFTRVDQRTDYLGIRHHAALVWDGSAVSLFVDGVRKKSGESHQDNNQTPPDPAFVLPKLDHYLIGACPAVNDGQTLTRFFQGILHGLRVSRTARYTADFSPDTRFAADQHTLALYHFDEGQGDVLTDSSGHGHHGKIVGAKWVPGNSIGVAPVVTGSALRFFRPASHVAIPGEQLVQVAMAKPWTVEGWLTVRDPICEEGQKSPVFHAANAALEIRTQTGKPYCMVAVGNSKLGRPYISDQPLRVDRPTHLALTHENGKLALWVDGRLQGQPVEILQLVPPETRQPLSPGPSEWAARERGGLNGDLDEVRISSVVRYREEFDPPRRHEPDAETLALYHLDAADGDILKDSSGHGHHGKIVGAKWVQMLPAHSAVAVQQRAEGGYEVTAPDYRLKIAATGQVESLEAGGTKLLESTEFGGMGTVKTRPVKATQSGTTLTFEEAGDYRLIYEFGPQGFVVKCRVSAAAAERDGIDGKAYYLCHQTHFAESAQRVRLLDAMRSFDLPATNWEEKHYTNNFVVDFRDGSQVEVKCDHPGEHSGFRWTGGPYTWGRTNLKLDADNEIRFDIRRPSPANLKFISTSPPIGEISPDEDGWLNLAAPSPTTGATTVISGVRARDVKISATVAKLTARNAHVFVRGDRGNNYFAAITPTNAFISIYDPKGSTVLKQAPLPPARDDGTYRVEFSAIGDRLQLRVNDRLLCEAVDARFRRNGDVGFGTTSESARFRDVELVVLDARPETTAGWHGWPADAPSPAIAPFDAAQAKQHQEAWAKHLGVPVEYENSIGMKFVLIPPGEFMMGSTPDVVASMLALASGQSKEGSRENWLNCIRSEAPQHKVILTRPIFLGVHEVTQKQFETVMSSAPSSFATTGAEAQFVKGLDTSDFPVETVAWHEAVEFCAVLSRRENVPGASGYRLPTEAEWENACRAGTVTLYWSGDKSVDLGRSGWHSVNGGGRTHKVGELDPNPFGLYDSYGNVWEWVRDGWDPAFYGRIAEKPAIDPESASIPGWSYVVRGGSYWHHPAVCRSAHRQRIGDVVYRSKDTGFRAALSVEAVRKQIAADAPPPAIAPFDAAQANQHQEAWATHLGVLVEYTNSIGMKFRLIPPGEFMMGSAKGDSNEAPPHKVTLTKPYYLGTYEATQEEYEAVIGSNPSKFNGKSLPVEFVTPQEAIDYCRKLAEKEGQTYRLPTEAEWEFACRGGTTSEWHFGDESALLGDHAWHNENAEGKSHPVGEKKSNAFGLHDMHGNVFEYCSDFTGAYAAEPAVDPQGPALGRYRGFRGGSWFFSPFDTRSANRQDKDWPARGSHVGIRVLLEVDSLHNSQVDGDLAVAGPGPAEKASAPAAQAAPPREIAEPP